MAHNIIIERDVMLPMRDGVRLATDVYRPDDGAKHPVLVNGHPYDNEGEDARGFRVGRVSAITHTQGSQ